MGNRLRRSTGCLVAGGQHFVDKKIAENCPFIKPIYINDNELAVGTCVDFMPGSFLLQPVQHKFRTRLFRWRYGPKPRAKYYRLWQRHHVRIRRFPTPISRPLSTHRVLLFQWTVSAFSPPAAPGMNNMRLHFWSGSPT